MKTIIDIINWACILIGFSFVTIKYWILRRFYWINGVNLHNRQMNILNRLRLLCPTILSSELECCVNWLYPPKWFNTLPLSCSNEWWKQRRKGGSTPDFSPLNSTWSRRPWTWSGGEGGTGRWWLITLIGMPSLSLIPVVTPSRYVCVWLCVPCSEGHDTRVFNEFSVIHNNALYFVLLKVKLSVKCSSQL